MSTNTASITQITPNLIRVRCNNPGVMTGTGTNTYIVHDEQEAWVIDPGPNEAEHVDNIFKACADRAITQVFVTHMHPDHSPAHAPIIERTGAILLGLNAVEDPYQDSTCKPGTIVKHEEVFSLNDSIAVQALLTPGHVDNHVCYLIQPDNIVVTGDHIMQGSTVVIIPPHGKMKEYIASLQLLLNYPIQALAPGHGEIIKDAQAEVEGIIKHRLAREEKVFAAVKKLQQSDTPSLVKNVYDDVDESLYPVAELSLLAHLIKLEQDGKVIKKDQQWSVLN